MEKDEFTRLLNENGLLTTEDKGIPMVTVSGDDDKMKEVLEKIKTLAKENGYGSSFGIVCRSSSVHGGIIDNENETESVDGTFFDEASEDVEFTQMSLF